MAERDAGSPPPASEPVQELDRLRHERDFLLAEINRRHRNMLGVIRSIVRRMTDMSESVEDFGMHLEGRLDAIGRWHALAGSASNASVRLDVLVGEELMAYQAKEDEQVTLDGPAIFLKAAAAESLGLAFHELATNALKFGALSTPSGHVTVSWSIDKPTGQLGIVWAETGGPAIPAPPKQRGLGSEILERLLDYDLKARTALAFGRGGLVCTIRLPLAATAVSEREPSPTGASA